MFDAKCNKIIAPDRDMVTISRLQYLYRHLHVCRAGKGYRLDTAEFRMQSSSLVCTCSVLHGLPHADDAELTLAMSLHSAQHPSGYCLRTADWDAQTQLAEPSLNDLDAVSPHCITRDHRDSCSLHQFASYKKGSV